MKEDKADAVKTFSNFIEGDSNRLARAMALAVSENPGGSYNPLYIYGGRGVGKSHLLSAIASYSKERGLKTALYHFDESTKGDHTNSSLPDMIIVDDIDFSKPTVIKDLLAFAEEGGQLVLSGIIAAEKLPANALSTLIDKKGKSADIQMPEEELRIAILKAKASDDDAILPQDAALFIAQHLNGDIQTLLGGYERVKALSSLSGQTITRFSAIQALKDYLWLEENKPVG
ncbi:MAG: hypothetical protein IME96_09530 [Proteobacteria bacterium]|nr:hypothetical protein [Pseudomonadota bacterium]